jgi:hypothetical protein
MKLLITFTLLSLFGLDSIEKPIDLSNDFDKIIPQMTCCSKQLGNGKLGDDYEVVTVTSCVMYEQTQETPNSAHARACDKAVVSAKKILTILENN